MSKKMDDSLFEDVEFGTESSMDDALFEDVEFGSEKPSQLEAAGLGAAQGLTFDFGDEIYGGLKGLLDYAIKDEDKSLKEEYQEERDVARNRIDQAYDEHPATYIASDVAGGVIPALFSGGATAAASVGKGLVKGATKGALKQASKEAAKVGAKYGAATGLGLSEAELIEGDVLGAAKDTALGAGLGAVAGVATPVGIEGTKRVIGKGKDLLNIPLSKAKKLIKSTGVGKEALNAYDLGKKGDSILGEDNYLKIIEESKTLVTEKLKPLLVTEAENHGKAIGKIMKRLNKLGETKNLSKELSSIEKQVENIISSGKAPTEEGRKVLSELVGLINNKKTEIIKVTRSKNVKTGTEKSLNILNKKINKMKKNAEEVGARLNFTEPKIDTEKGLITVFETTTGKPITEVITTGEFTPIKYAKSAQYEDFDINKLKALKDSAYEVLNKAKKQDVGVAKKPIARTYGIAKESIDEIAEGADLSKALESANQGFSTVKNADSILPASILNGDSSDVNKIAQFLRKSESEGISGDDLRDRLMDFGKELIKVDPKQGQLILDEASNIAAKYDLARTAKQSFGLNLGTAKAIGVIGGQVTGLGVNSVSKKVAKVAKVANKVGAISDEGLSVVSQKLNKSDNAGLQAMGRQVQQALESDEAIKKAMIWSLSQQPAFRQAAQDQLPKFDADMQSDLGAFESEVIEPEMESEQRNPFPRPAEDIIENPSRGPASYFKKQTEDINDDVKPEMLTMVEQVGRSLGYEDIIMSSGRRDVESTMKILEQRKEQYNLNDFSDEDQKIIDTLLLRGDSPDNIEYANRGDVNKVLLERFPERAEELIETFREVRKNFGGLQSSHLQGNKMDVPYSFFVDKYGKEDGNKRAEKFIQALRDSGLKVIDEKNAGRHGVIDIDGSELPESEPITNTSEPLANNESNPQGVEEALNEIDRVNQQQSAGDITPTSQLDDLLGKLNKLQLAQKDIDLIENEAIQMEGFSDGQRLKDLITKLHGIS